jgi:hypothetical protein
VLPTLLEVAVSTGSSGAVNRALSQSAALLSISGAQVLNWQALGQQDEAEVAHQNPQLMTEHAAMS